MGKLLLDDKHKLAWAEYGAPDGEPVFYFHGVLGSRLEAQPADEIARDLGIRLIVPERPGYGDSDPQHHFLLLDWPGVVSQLADRLNLKRFSILGFSGGGAYALACAYKIPERIKRITLVGSMAPFETEAMQNHICADLKPLYELAATDEAATLQQLSKMVTSPESVMAVVEATLAPCDKALFKQDNIQDDYLKNLSLATKNGVQGVANDLRNMALPWQYRLGDIQLPIDIWHGREDNNVGFSIAEYLDGVLNNTSAHFLDNCGHYFLFDHWYEVLEHSKLRGLTYHADTI